MIGPLRSSAFLPRAACHPPVADANLGLSYQGSIDLPRYYPRIWGALEGSSLAIPDYETLMLPVLRLATKGEARIPDVAEKLAEEFDLSQEERDQISPSGRQRVLHNRAHWAKFYMSKAGLIVSTRRGWFTASDAGRAFLAENPKRIDVARLMAIPSFANFRRGEADGLNNADTNTAAATSLEGNSTPEEQIEAAHLVLGTALRDDLLERILQSSPPFFESVIVGLLVAMGYGGSQANAAAQLGRTGDGGVDGVINEDRLGLDRIYVQAKRYALGNTIGRPEVQGFVGSLVGLGATKGVFVTTSTFSLQAAEYVRHLSQRIVLIDGQRLADFMIEHNVGVRVSRAIEIKRVDEDFFVEDD